MARRVWMFLVKVEALSGGETLTPGSEAQIQVCVPGEQLETALRHLEQHLISESYRRLDLTVARRFDLDDESEDYPADYLRGDLEDASETGKSTTSCVIMSETSASFLPKKPN